MKEISQVTVAIAAVLLSVVPLAAIAGETDHRVHLDAAAGYSVQRGVTGANDTYYSALGTFSYAPTKALGLYVDFGENSVYGHDSRFGEVSTFKQPVYDVGATLRLSDRAFLKAETGQYTNNLSSVRGFLVNLSTRVF